MADSDITAPLLREILSYNPDTGNFTWKISPTPNVAAGTSAGSVEPNGYIRIRIFGRGYGAHRLAFLHVNGAWPSYLVDHIDGNQANNAISNLRDATASVNQQNRRVASAANKSNGLLGVSRAHTKRTRWIAKIRVNKKAIHLGYFDTPEEAHAAYITAKRALHEGCTI